MEKQEILVFKIGGAGLENSERIKVFSDDINSLLNQKNNNVKVIVVCSAFKGVTRLLDSTFQDWKVGNYISMNGKLQDFYFIHKTIISELFSADSLIHGEFETLYECLKKDLNKKKRINKEEMRANVLQYGEIVSSKILSNQFFNIMLDNKLIDVRHHIKTKTSGSKTWIYSGSEKSIHDSFTWLTGNKLIITQGFIGRDYKSGKNTVLPFNWSDTSAAFIAHSVKANKIFFLKDIAGVSANDDVKPGDVSNFYQWMTYKEYLEKFKGKKVYPVHPQAIQILRRRKIPVRICCFMYPNSYGTEIKS